MDKKEIPAKPSRKGKKHKFNSIQRLHNNFSLIGFLNF
jgi:hypothetical protein